MCAMLVDFVASNHSLEEQERVEVLMRPTRGIVEDTDGRIEHLIVPNHQQTRVEYSFF